MKRSKSEKRFIKVLLLPALLALAAAGLCSCAQRNTDYSEDLFAMDTVMSIRAIGPDAEEAVKAAVSEIRRLDSLLSTGNDSSDISAINRNKTAQTDQDTALLAFRAKEIYRLTGGAFDPTVYPVMRLWGFTDRNYQVPEEEALQAAAATVNGESLQIDGNTVSVAADQEMERGSGITGWRP